MGSRPPELKFAHFVTEPKEGETGILRFAPECLF
jgi:hypothetical protein